MARRKLSRILDLEKGQIRLSAVKSIDPNLDLGNGINIANYETALKALSDSLSAYNTTLSTVDDLYNQCISNITAVRDLNERILTGVATKYGKNSSQYEMAGGKRKSEKKKPTKSTS